jgi:hypothetical protein
MTGVCAALSMLICSGSWARVARRWRAAQRS